MTLRLADRILSNGVSPPHATVNTAEFRGAWSKYESAVKNQILRSPIIAADNVYEYLRGQTEEIELYLLPCAAPPFDELWVEYNQRNGKQMGILAVAANGPFRLDGFEPFGPVGDNGYQPVRPKPGTGGTDTVGEATEIWVSNNLPDQSAWDQVRWVWILESILQYDNRGMGPLNTIRAALDASGQLLDVTFQIHSDYAIVNGGHQSAALAVFNTFMQTMNFMQCANIRTQYVQPSGALSRKHRKRGHLQRDLVRYQILRLDPVGPSQRNRGTQGSDGNATAWHRVRGEFHHYGNCCPGAHAPKGKLFGKHEGRFWVPSHERGNRRHGTVISDFTIKPVTEDPVGEMPRPESPAR